MLTDLKVLAAVGGAPAVLAVIALHATADAAAPNDAARAFLASSLNVTAADVQRIDSGHVVARTLEASDRREVATLGIVRVRMTPEFYVERLADIATFKRDEAVLQIGAFADSPDMRDVAELTLDDADIRSLRLCRVGNCGVQLSADAIERFRRLDWHRADASQEANVLMRRILVDYVSEYRRTGAVASMQYEDQAIPVNLGAEFASLVESDLGAWRRFPVLRGHLFAYPEGGTEGSIDLLYWSKERVGRKNVISVTHLAICPTVNSPVEYAIASKQIYGTHYFDASLGLTILIRDHSTPTAATYLAYVNRSRIDIFEGLFGGIARRVVTSKARSTVADQLARLQGTLERQFQRGARSANPQRH
jgi:hypothetical protein